MVSRASRIVGTMAAVRTLREFFLGVSLFFRGFSLWAADPGLMVLGAIPALIVGLVLVAWIVGLAVVAPALAEWLTPFAEGWDGPWTAVLRIALTIAIVAAGVFLGVMTYAAVTLTVSEPFRERISQLTERRFGGIAAPVETPFWRGVARGIGDGLKLFATGLVTSLLVFVIGLIPVVGGVLGWTTGAFVGGRALAIELTGTPGDARGIPLVERQRLLARRRAVALGFGVCCYLMFLIPGGAVIGTPAATAGGTLLLRELLGEPTREADAPSVRPGDGS